jgi:hypothetical protein
MQRFVSATSFHRSMKIAQWIPKSLNFMSFLELVDFTPPGERFGKATIRLIRARGPDRRPFMTAVGANEVVPVGVGIFHGAERAGWNSGHGD